MRSRSYKLVGVAVFAAALAAIPGSARQSKPAALLPDLAQDPPGRVSVQQVEGRDGTEFRLGFRSAVRNVGKGALIVHGRRSSTTSQIRADQLVRLSNGRLRRYRDVLPMRYAYSETHDHFHVLGFDRYSLRDARTGVRVRPDQKTGFCLGDRDETGQPRVHPPPYYGPRTGECERGRPNALRVVEGLTPGYLDDYGPQLEGQYINITGLPAGRYSLVHRVNADGRIKARNRKNDVASALIQIGWPNGAQRPPAVKVLAKCREHALCRRPVRAASLTAEAPVLTAAETKRFRLWCSLLEPARQPSGAAARARKRRIAASRRAWLTAAARVQPIVP